MVKIIKSKTRTSLVNLKYVINIFSHLNNIISCIFLSLASEIILHNRVYVYLRITIFGEKKFE